MVQEYVGFVSMAISSLGSDEVVNFLISFGSFAIGVLCLVVGAAQVYRHPEVEARNRDPSP